MTDNILSTTSHGVEKQTISRNMTDVMRANYLFGK